MQTTTTFRLLDHDQVLRDLHFPHCPPVFSFRWLLWPFQTGGESDVVCVDLVPLDAVSKLHWNKGRWNMMSTSGLPNNSILPLKKKEEFRLMHHYKSRNASESSTIWLILITKIRKLLEINHGVYKNVFTSYVVARVTFNNNNNSNNKNNNNNNNIFS